MCFGKPFQNMFHVWKIHSEMNYKHFRNFISEDAFKKIYSKVNLMHSKNFYKIIFKKSDSEKIILEISFQKSRFEKFLKLIYNLKFISMMGKVVIGKFEEVQWRWNYGDDGGSKSTMSFTKYSIREQ